MKQILSFVSLSVCSYYFVTRGWADATVVIQPLPSPTLSTVASIVTAVNPTAPLVPVSSTTIGSDFLTQVFHYITGFGGLTFVLKISGLVALIIASMKVSFMAPVWAKLGYFKVLATPLLSLIIGVCVLFSGSSFSYAALGSYLFAGGGAVFIHEILDCLKAIPGISPHYLNMIALATRLLGGPDPLPPDAAIPAGMGTPSVPSANTQATATTGTTGPTGTTGT